MLSRFINQIPYHGIKFRQTFQCFNKFWKVCYVLGLDNDTDDRSDREHSYTMRGATEAQFLYQHKQQHHWVLRTTVQPCMAVQSLGESSGYGSFGT